MSAVTTVYFIDSGDWLQVHRGCKVCGVTQDNITRREVVVSPSGVAHHTDEYGDTDCGKDATRATWWWPL